MNIGSQPQRKPPETPFQESVWILPESDAAAPLQLSSTGITRRDPSYHIQRAGGASYYVLECILSGKGSLFVGEEHFSPEAGDVYLLPPFIPNEYYADADDPWEKIWFNVSGVLFDNLVNAYQLPGVIFIHQAGLEQEFRRGMETVRQGNADAAESLSLILHRILHRLFQLRNVDSGVSSPDARQLKDYLDSHWSAPFSLASLSSCIQRSPAQTMRIFKGAFHTTPKKYHTRRKLIYAAQYLRNTNYTIRMIADYLGFANEFHFSSWFKQQTGQSPKYFRSGNGQLPEP